MGQGEESAKIHSLLLPLSLLPAASFTARTSWVLYGVGVCGGAQEKSKEYLGVTCADSTLAAHFSENACSPTGAIKETRTQSQGDIVKHYRNWQQFPVPYQTPKLPVILFISP